MLVLLTACSSSEPGSAELISDTSANQPQGPGSPSMSNQDADGTTTSSLEPCTLLTKDDISSFATFEDPEETAMGGARGCDFYPVRTDASDLPSIGVAVRDRQSVDNANDEGLGTSTGELNGRQVTQVPTRGGCIIAMAVGDRSRVDVTVTGLDTQVSCDVAGQVAEIIEPRLPAASTT
ncbi:DUF3558 family protein [Prauserella sp. PE36]|uniref:DUF3558 family protein n=1 Tax=Prauserella sp. PE36 TaxID=1504709 RepID=UPI00131470D8|nr:DUF3558 family protein [Prauserella sp. PE36]